MSLPKVRQSAFTSWIQIRRSNFFILPPLQDYTIGLDFAREEILSSILVIFLFQKDLQ